MKNKRKREEKRLLFEFVQFVRSYKIAGSKRILFDCFFLGVERGKGGAKGREKSRKRSFSVFLVPNHSRSFLLFLFFESVAALPCPHFPSSCSLHTFAPPSQGQMKRRSLHELGTKCRFWWRESEKNSKKEGELLRLSEGNEKA